ncbi:MAG: response regulator [Bacteroidota bacterium]
MTNLPKLKCILFIDDDEPTNYLNRRLATQLDCAEKIITIDQAEEALAYLKAMGQKEIPVPDLIFLDINMPQMNGWEFLDEYSDLDEDNKKSVIIIMLTTSLNPDDSERAKQYTEVNELKNKPLTLEMLREVVEKYFASRTLVSSVH